MIIEYMDCGSLRELMKTAQQKKFCFTESMLALIAVQILGGISFLHVAAKQAHLDIKPENILINSLG